MNRISTLAAPSAHPKSSVARLKRPALHVATPRHDSPLCLLAPLHYERNYAYPLLVWLHGPEGDEREVKRVMPLVSLRNYVSVAVRGPATERRGFGWPETADGILAAESRIDDAVAQARQKFNVHPERIYLAGYGAGGTMGLRLALRRPDRYAGAASLAGQFPAGHAPLSRLAAIRRSRLLIMHCRDSQAYPIDRVCQELALFHSAGLSVTLRQYPCGDELTTQMLSDLDVWLMEQVTGVAAARTSEPAPLPSEWN
jgi:phospholipase/carboxylesterase